MKNNNTYQEIWDEIKKHNRFSLLTHINTDGDTIGSSIAFKHILLENLEDVEVKISGQEYPRYLAWMEKNDEVSDEYFNESLKIVIDTSNYSRVYDKRVVTKEAIKIDHHHDQEEWLLKVGGDHWPATGEVIYEMAEELGLRLNSNAKLAIAISIWTDTEEMTEREPSERTFEILDTLCSELRLTYEDLRDNVALPEEDQVFVDSKKKDVIKENDRLSWIIMDDFVDNHVFRKMGKQLSDVHNTEVFVFSSVDEKGYRTGFKSTNYSKINVGAIAKTHGGGGHMHSSGTYASSREEAQKIVDNVLEMVK